jgi:hypothetical protein
MYTGNNLQTNEPVISVPKHKLVEHQLINIWACMAAVVSRTMERSFIRQRPMWLIFAFPGNSGSCTVPFDSA